MKKERCLSTIAKYLRFVSLGKVSPGLFYKGELAFSTVAGGFVTLCIVGIVLTFFIINLMATLSDHNFYA